MQGKNMNCFLSNFLSYTGKVQPRPWRPQRLTENEPYIQIMRFIVGHDCVYHVGSKHLAHVFRRQHIDSFSIVGHIIVATKIKNETRQQSFRAFEFNQCPL